MKGSHIAFACYTLLVSSNLEQPPPAPSGYIFVAYSFVRDQAGCLVECPLSKMCLFPLGCICLVPLFPVFLVNWKVGLKA